VVESVIEHTRTECSGAHLRIEAFDAGALAESIAQEYAALAKAKGVAFDVRIADGLEPLASDPRVVRRVLRGLVDNAVKFTARDESVELAVDASNGRLRFVVKDTGKGIAMADQTRVFDAFETVETIRHKHVPGLGLGLAIVRASVEALDGQIDLVSRPGNGCTFTVVLPSLDRGCLGRPVTRGSVGPAPGQPSRAAETPYALRNSGGT